MNDQFHQAIARFDAVGAEDPRTVSYDGSVVPHQLAEAACIQRYVAQLEPTPSVALQLAVHCQHLRRFAYPRSAFPAGREGYLAWRTDAAQQSANEAARILRDLDFDPTTIEQVVGMMTKRDRKHTADVQTMEDALCLTFFRLDALAFANQHDLAEVSRILRRSWLKMSARGRAIALNEPYPEPLHGLLRALGAPDADTGG